MLKRFKRYIRWRSSDAGFSTGIDQFESLVSKLLSIAMLVVIVVIVVDLILFLATALFNPSPEGFFINILRDIFGLFLSALIALEILENITAYLRKHVVQVELVIVTSLIAVARKIIILDLDKVSGTSLIGLAIAIFALSISYWIVRTIHR
ncbi:MAG: phosphate-starvation-inducible PsiE family protein [Cyanobacteria bacterium P01_H01_bin.21]